MNDSYCHEKHQKNQASQNDNSLAKPKRLHKFISKLPIEKQVKKQTIHNNFIVKNYIHSVL